MARDRQRSKQRRRRSAQGGGNPARSRAADIGLDDATIEESGLTDTAPAPDPLKNASADVDQARAAETGADRGPPGEVDVSSDAVDVSSDAVDVSSDEEPVFDGETGQIYADELEPAPDEAETPADLQPTGRGGRHLAEREAASHHRRERGKIITFLRACIDELRRVQWPDRKHVFQATAVVLGFVLIAGGWLGLMDAIWQPLINAIL